MAIPTDIVKRDGVQTLAGTVIALFPSDTDYDIEIQRAPDSAGSPDVGNAESIAITPGEQQTYIDELPTDGDPRHYRIRHVRTGETASDWTPWVAITPKTFISAYRQAPVVPSVDERPSDDGATGTLDLVITDPQNRLVSVEGKSRSGNGTEEAAWQTLSLAGGSYSDTVDLALKHPSTIRYKIESYDELGNLVSYEKVVPFPLASKPAKPIVTLSIDSSGNVVAHVEGDPDTVNIRAAGSNSAYPNEATVDGEAPIAGNSIDTGTLVTLATGETGYVSVKAYDSTPTGSDVTQALITAGDQDITAAPDPPSLVVLTATIEKLTVIN